MRSMMLAATLALSSLVAHEAAEACGGSYLEAAPSLFLVDTTYAGDAFVVLNTPVKREGLTWTMLYPRSYDLTSVAVAPDFATPVTVTLVGPAGRTTLTTKKQVFVANGFQVREPTGAIRLARKKGEVRVALFGTATDAGWEELTEATVTATTKAWAKRAGLDGEYMRSQQGAQELETLTAYVNNKVVTQVRIHGADYGSGIGTPIGVFSNSTGRFLVLRDETKLTTLRLW